MTAELLAAWCQPPVHKSGSLTAPKDMISITPQKIVMPTSLEEISGIAFYKANR